MKTKSINVCYFWAAMMAGLAHADEWNLGKSIPSKEDVVKHFSQSNPSTSAVNASSGDYEGDPEVGRSRTIDSDFGSMSERKSPRKQPHKIRHSAAGKDIDSPSLNPIQAETALSMEILFPYNSADLTDAAKKMLKPVGEGLATTELKNLSFVIEGYTDATGGSEYNKTLSEQRAESVKNYLTGQYRVDASRLQIIGKGESDLLIPDDPDNEANRRVRIVATK